MPRRSSPRGEILIGTVEEVHTEQAREWRERTAQERADLFVELIRTWRPDAPGLARTARIATVP